MKELWIRSMSLDTCKITMEAWSLPFMMDIAKA
jgi:hypothetical protein